MPEPTREAFHQQGVEVNFRIFSKATGVLVDNERPVQVLQQHGKIIKPGADSEARPKGTPINILDFGAAKVEQQQNVKDGKRQEQSGNPWFGAQSLSQAPNPIHPGGFFSHWFSLSVPRP